MKHSLAVFLTAILISASAYAEDIGHIESVDPPGGSVAVKDAQGATQQLPVGSPLSASQHVLPSAGQTVLLKLKDGSEVSAAPGSDISVSDYVPSQPSSVPHVKLDSGAAHFDVNKTSTGHSTFFIKTHSATMGVRGTEFIIDQQTDGYSVVHTLDGRVAMAKSETDLESPDKSVEVKAGKTSYLHPSMTAPAAPKVFNRKTYLTQLQKAYPGLMKSVNRSHKRQLQRDASMSKEERLKKLKEAQQEKEARPPKRRPRPKKNQ